jgi:hypothetical protein
MQLLLWCSASSITFPALAGPGTHDLRAQHLTTSGRDNPCLLAPNNNNNQSNSLPFSSICPSSTRGVAVPERERREQAQTVRHTREQYTWRPPVETTVSGYTTLQTTGLQHRSGTDYEECRLLGYKNPLRTSQETYYVSATESSQLMLCKI